MIIEDLSSNIEKIRSFMKNGYYRNVVTDSMRLIEEILRKIYKEAFFSLPIDVKEKIFSFEKSKNKTFEEITLGGIIGLFKNCHLLKIYADKEKKTFVHFNYNNLLLHTSIRNKCIHHSYKCSENEAKIIFNTLLMILKELEIDPEIYSEKNIKYDETIIINGTNELDENFEKLSADLKNEDFENFEIIWNKFKQKIPPQSTIYTLKQRKKNEILRYEENGIIVKTNQGTKKINKILIKKAWDTFIHDGVLFQGEHEESTYRSSFILALFSQLDAVKNDTKRRTSIRLKKNI